MSDPDESSSFWDGKTFAVGTVIAMHFAKKVPPISAVSFGLTLLKTLDQGMEREAVESVRNANRGSDGKIPPIILLSSWEPAKSTFTSGSGHPVGKADLEKWVQKAGGTAWFQVGSNNRTEAYWHLRKDFQPKSPKQDPGKPGQLALSLGHVVHGDKDAE